MKYMLYCQVRLTGQKRLYMGSLIDSDQIPKAGVVVEVDDVDVTVNGDGKVTNRRFFKYERKMTKRQLVAERLIQRCDTASDRSSSKIWLPPSFSAGGKEINILSNRTIKDMNPDDLRDAGFGGKRTPGLNPLASGATPF